MVRGTDASFQETARLFLGIETLRKLCKYGLAIYNKLGLKAKLTAGRKSLDLSFALRHQSNSNRLYATGREVALHLAPEHWRKSVSNKPV